MSDRELLRECPFCGEAPVVNSLHQYAYCPVHTHSMSYGEWNRRHSAPQSAGAEQVREGSTPRVSEFETVNAHRVDSNAERQGLYDLACQLERELRHHKEMLNQAEHELSLATARIAECERDAARYQALCRQDSMAMPRVLPPFIDEPTGHTAYNNKAAIDAAIDAAITANGGRHNER